MSVTLRSWSRFTHARPSPGVRCAGVWNAPRRTRVRQAAVEAARRRSSRARAPHLATKVVVDDSRPSRARASRVLREPSRLPPRSGSRDTADDESLSSAAATAIGRPRGGRDRTLSGLWHDDRGDRVAGRARRNADGGSTGRVRCRRTLSPVGVAGTWFDAAVSPIGPRPSRPARLRRGLLPSEARRFTPDGGGRRHKHRRSVRAHDLDARRSDAERTRGRTRRHRSHDRGGPGCVARQQVAGRDGGRST